MPRFADEKVHHYSKTVEISDTGMVIASVFANAEDGHELRRVGLKFFSSFPFGVENRAKKAHSWADEYMNMCKRQEVQKETK